MLSNSNHSRLLNVTENCINFTEIAPANPHDMSHPMYHDLKRDAYTEYLGRVKMALSSCMDGINLANLVNTRKAHKEHMT